MKNKLQIFIRQNTLEIAILPSQSMEIIQKMRQVMGQIVGPTLEALKNLHDIKSEWGSCMHEYREALVKQARDPLNQRIVQVRQRLKEDLLDIFKAYKSEFERFATNYRVNLTYIFSNAPDYTKQGLRNYLETMMQGGCESPGGATRSSISDTNQSTSGPGSPPAQYRQVMAPHRCSQVCCPS